MRRRGTGEAGAGPGPPARASGTSRAPRRERARAPQRSLLRRRRRAEDSCRRRGGRWVGPGRRKVLAGARWARLAYDCLAGPRCRVWSAVFSLFSFPFGDFNEERSI